MASVLPSKRSIALNEESSSFADTETVLRSHFVPHETRPCTRSSLQQGIVKSSAKKTSEADTSMLVLHTARDTQCTKENASQKRQENTHQRAQPSTVADSGAPVIVSSSGASQLEESSYRRQRKQGVALKGVPGEFEVAETERFTEVGTGANFSNKCTSERKTAVIDSDGAAVPRRSQSGTTALDSGRFFPSGFLKKHEKSREELLCPKTMAGELVGASRECGPTRGHKEHSIKRDEQISARVSRAFVSHELTTQSTHKSVSDGGPGDVESGKTTETVTDTRSRICSPRCRPYANSAELESGVSRQSRPTAPLIQRGDGCEGTLNGSIHLSTFSGAFASQHSGDASESLSLSGLFASSTTSRTATGVKLDASSSGTPSSTRRLNREKDESSTQHQSRRLLRGSQMRMNEGEITRNSSSDGSFMGSTKSEMTEGRLSEKRKTRRERGPQNSEMERGRGSTARGEGDESHAGSGIKSSRGSRDGEEDATCTGSVRSSEGKQGRRIEAGADGRNTEAERTGTSSSHGRKTEKSESARDLARRVEKGAEHMEMDICAAVQTSSRDSSRTSNANGVPSESREQSSSSVLSSSTPSGRCQDTHTCSVSSFKRRSSSIKSGSLQYATREYQENVFGSFRSSLSLSGRPSSAAEKRPTKMCSAAGGMESPGILAETVSSECRLMPRESQRSVPEGDEDGALYFTSKSHTSCSSTSRSMGVSHESAPHSAETADAQKKTLRSRHAGSSHERASLRDEEGTIELISLQKNVAERSRSYTGDKKVSAHSCPTLKGTGATVGKHRHTEERASTSQRYSSFPPGVPALPKALQRLSALLTGEKDNAELRALTQIQQCVINHVATQAIVESAVARLRMERCLRANNISRDELENVEAYLVSKMPLTIGVDLLNVMPHLLEDNHYRSRFELKSQAQLAEASERRTSEAALFNGFYDHASVRPEHRPKHGLLNVYLYPYADSRFHSPSQAFLLLEEHVRVRVTVAASRNRPKPWRQRVGTLADMWHVLDLLGNRQIKEILDIANGRRGRPELFDDEKLPQFHVHGGLDLNKDVAAVAVRKSEYEARGRVREYLDQISQKYLFPIITCEELDELLAEGRGWYTAVRERGHALIQRSAAMQNTSGFI
ncbi:hypothetical protein BESB_039120 [Besnoitia besnoiti]|uniref:Uncharacterized protein n=1 Tax=Besnoitia besnoiti TaxID=94643 RepID=A0A2A9MJU3_BESBE|nr:hypothetical protein BESB_039120 [Besnoitia besnoiti]PFH37454.1 hypothetical protein BESB_039120 [Besnoitia besnoiti]